MYMLLGQPGIYAVYLIVSTPGDVFRPGSLWFVAFHAMVLVLVYGLILYSTTALEFYTVFSSAGVYTAELLPWRRRPSSGIHPSVKSSFSEPAAWIQAKFCG